MSNSQLLDVAHFCNRFPNIDMTNDVMDSENVMAGEDLTLHVTLEWDLEGRSEYQMWDLLIPQGIPMPRRRMVACT
ncbi:U5 small nuclear ribonucleoprotein helicase [Thalictrum thalictroides]|uniref:U5 small nuclear ribonucleoprotein helicase n=1 Tax=Thalictrum thalictroides TaxID=46969 RepID=A0A7J6W1N0_THATH|nr:U5 small nuclear ribonucleoprotein helicase [Thalictrum thalictroides]